MILAASSMFNSCSKAAPFAPTLVKASTDLSSLDSGEGLAKLGVVSTTAGCYCPLWNYENRSGLFFNGKCHPEGGRLHFDCRGLLKPYFVERTKSAFKESELVSSVGARFFFTPFRFGFGSRSATL
jgi:hypothetical protein